MAEIKFYHLENSTVYESLPTLLQKVSDMGITATVIVPTHMLDKISEVLWQGGRPENFIAHDVGVKSDAPFVLTDKADNISLRSTVFVVDEMTAELVAGLDLVCYMFHGRDGIVLENARVLWKALSEDSDNTVVYFKQTVSGGWAKKA